MTVSSTSSRARKCVSSTANAAQSRRRAAHECAAWPYEPAEITADLFVHMLSVTLASAGFVVLALLVSRVVNPWEVAGALVYGISLVVTFTVSAVYNLWPISKAKWILRRVDHSAIYTSSP